MLRRPSPRNWGWVNPPSTEALRTIERIGLVTLEPYLGAIVKSVGHETARLLTPVRLAIEEVALTEAIKNSIDPARLRRDIALMLAAEADIDAFFDHHMNFHRYICEATGRPEIEEVWEATIWRSSNLFTTGHVWNVKGAALSHWPIVHVVEAGDRDGVSKVVHDHVMFSGDTDETDGES